MNPWRRVACLIVISISLSAPAGCGAPPAPTVLPSSTTFLYASSSEVIFLRWAAHAAASNGTVERVRRGSARTTADFSVTWTEGGFSFSFEPGSLAGWTGRLADDGLELVIPADAGGLRGIALRPATVEAFDQAVASLD